MKLPKIGGTDLHIKSSKFRQVIISVLILLCVYGRANAADISALDFNGGLLGKVIPDGAVINFENELIGHITADGFVIDNEGEFVGGIVPQGIAVSVNNKILGKINNDGTVTSVNDSLVGKVLPNGLIVNNNYDVIGAVVSPGVVYNDRGNIIGRVSGDGKFYNLSGEISGYVSASGYVYTNEGTEKKITLSGRVISAKIVVSSSGKFLGSIGPDGKIIDLKKNAIGTIHANGFAYNADGTAIGHIVEKGYAFNLDGTYLGVISYNGEIISKEKSVAVAAFGNRVLDKNGNLIGFTINAGTTVNSLEGKSLGYVIAGGNVVKGRNIIGKVGASGDIINTTGEVIGVINNSGPVYDFLGQLRGEASINGMFNSLDGIEQGYMQKNRAYDRKEKEIGRLLGNRLNFSNSNAFMGINGVNSILNYDKKLYTLSPYGYIFDEQQSLAGRNYEFTEVYSPKGDILSSIASTGRVEKRVAGSDSAKLTGAGFFISQNDELLGKTIKKEYVTDFLGNSLGYTNMTNLVINLQNDIYAKILPTGNIAPISPQHQKQYGYAGEDMVSVSINGDYLGISTLDGSIKKNGEVTGKITSSQYVIDNFGALYGKTTPFGAIISPECRFLGVVSESGDARTAQGGYLGMVLTNNQVVSDTEEVIGYVITPRAVIGKDGKVIGVQTPLGTVLNYKNQNLGCQDVRGRIKNPQSDVIGRIIPNNTSVMDFNNKIIGYADFSGTISDTDGTEKGYVDLNGGILSKQDKEIGVLFEYTVAFDNNNIYMGRVNASGDVVSDTGEIIGKVSYDGVVTTKDKRTGFALYDLYVYDNEEKTVGYIARNGRVYSIMGDMIGTMYKGFVLDKKKNLIARGNRDYNIRNTNQEIIGYLGLDGKVINIRNIEVGTLTDNGNIRNSQGDIIAQARSLQYYNQPKEITPAEIAPTETERAEMEQKNTDETSSVSVPQTEKKTDDRTSTGKDFKEKSGKIAETKNEYQDEGETQDGNFLKKIIGIAMTPGGKIIGNVNEDNEVVDDEGRTIGEVDENGEIRDKTGSVVGEFQAERAEKPRGVNREWWQNNIVRGTTINPHDNTSDVTNVGPGGGIGPGGRYNPRRAAILNQLQTNRRHALSGKVISNNTDTAAYTGWQENWGYSRSISSLRVDMSNMITADKPIPAVLARSLISLGNAPVTAIVERNIYGDMGRNIVIPAGSKIIGGLQTAEEENRFDGTSGGVKMEISWERIIRPDGISFRLDSSQTADAQGRGGGALGYVDEQMVKKYTVPLFGTMATSAMAYMMAANDDATGEVETSKQQAASDARSNFLDKMNDILDQIIESKSQIEAVTFVPAGTRIIIYPMVDLWLKTTKEIDKNVGSSMEDKEKAEVLVKDTNVNAGSEKQVAVQGSNAQNNNGGGTALIQENPNQGQPQQNTQGALPPPPADGTGMRMPEGDEENDDGEIDLDF